jgi:hypothetical protein
MDKARASLMNLDYGLFPKACDHECTSEIGWLLYSARQQDEERVSEMISNLVNETIGAQWRPIRTNDRQRAEPTDPQDRVHALHLEGAEETALRIRQKIKKMVRMQLKRFSRRYQDACDTPFQTLITFG